MGQREDLTGVVFNGLTGVRPTDRRECGSIVWVWKCLCGEEFESRATQVKNGHTKSCGCLKRRFADVRKVCRHCGEISNRRNQNGCFSSVCFKCWNQQVNAAKDGIPRYVTWHAARTRAKRAGIPFSITETDIVVPDRCPIFGITLTKTPGKKTDSSPSLDRIIPGLGYVPGNVAVVSERANRIKNNGTADEHRRIADWMDAQQIPWSKEVNGHTEAGGVVWENVGELVTA